MTVAVGGKTRLFSMMFCLLVVADSLTVAREVLHVKIMMVEGRLIHGTIRTKGDIRSKA